MPGVSLKPSEFIEGGVVPVDKNLLWRECRFNLFNYTKKDGTVVATTTAARIIYVDDDKNEYVQQYSAADPERFVPSEDGKTLVAVGSAQALAKSSNFYLLLNALLNAGMPENQIGDDISVLDGLYTYNIGLPEPKRAGLRREVAAGEEERQRVISVPAKILKAPWDKDGRRARAGSIVSASIDAASRAAKAASKVAEESEDEEGNNGLTVKLIDFVTKHLVDGKTTRQKVAGALFRDMDKKDPDRDACAALLFNPGFQAALLGAGFAISGETISKS